MQLSMYVWMDECTYKEFSPMQLNSSCACSSLRLFASLPNKNVIAPIYSMYVNITLMTYIYIGKNGRNPNGNHAPYTIHARYGLKPQDDISLVP